MVDIASIVTQPMVGQGKKIRYEVAQERHKHKNFQLVSEFLLRSIILFLNTWLDFAQDNWIILD